MDEEWFLRNAMEAHGDTVYRLALCRLQSVPDAEDVYQEVFLRLLRAGKQDWDGEHMKAWLIRTALSRCADLRRLRLRRSVLPLEAVPELPAETAEEGKELWEAVAALPEKFRTVVHLHYAEGYRTAEIAQLLGCPAATVRSRLRRACGKLKDILGGVEDEEESLWELDGTDRNTHRAQ